MAPDALAGVVTLRPRSQLHVEVVPTVTRAAADLEAPSVPMLSTSPRRRSVRGRGEHRHHVGAKPRAGPGRRAILFITTYFARPSAPLGLLAVPPLAARDHAARVHGATGIEFGPSHCDPRGRRHRCRRRLHHRRDRSLRQFEAEGSTSTRRSRGRWVRTRSALVASVVTTQPRLRPADAVVADPVPAAGVPLILVAVIGSGLVSVLVLPSMLVNLRPSLRAQFVGVGTRAPPDHRWSQRVAGIRR